MQGRREVCRAAILDAVDKELLFQRVAGGRLIQSSDPLLDAQQVGWPDRRHEKRIEPLDRDDVDQASGDPARASKQ